MLNIRFCFNRFACTLLIQFQFSSIVATFWYMFSLLCLMDGRMIAQVTIFCSFVSKLKNNYVSKWVTIEWQIKVHLRLCLAHCLKIFERETWKIAPGKQYIYSFNVQRKRNEKKHMQKRNDTSKQKKENEEKCHNR